MLLLIRRIKRRLFANQQFRNYLLYELGEMVLVVLGILIALQINNWNTQKQQREKLRNYLEIIAKNIGSDLASIHEIRTERERAYEASVQFTQMADRDGILSIPEVTFASRAYALASAMHHFNANTSGHEALKSSGTLNQVAGSDIESLLYDYYDTISRIVLHERDYNEYVRLLLSQVLVEWPAELDEWEFSNPKALTTERFRSLEPAYVEVLSGASAGALFWAPQSFAPLMLEYNKLDHLGHAFRRMVETGVMDFDDTIIPIIDGIYDPRSGIGDPMVITDGRLGLQSYALMIADANDPRVSYEASDANLKSPFVYNSIERRGDSLHIDYRGGVEWAGIWFPSGTIDSIVPRDYSCYEKLVVELKGDAGGETILVNIEDRDDPPDGTSTKVPLTLTDQWKTYEIGLDDFKTADLEILTVPLGFVFNREPVSFSLRSVKYVTSD
jgi:hypothetical protein